MTVLIVDGIEVDTTTWIDEQVARFRSQSESLVTRCSKLSNEIAQHRRIVESYEKQHPRDAFGEAHAKVYLRELVQLEKELAEEWNKKAKSVIVGASNTSTNAEGKKQSR